MRLGTGADSVPGHAGRRGRHAVPIAAPGPELAAAQRGWAPQAAACAAAAPARPPRRNVQQEGNRCGSRNRNHFLEVEPVLMLTPSPPTGAVLQLHDNIHALDALVTELDAML